MPLRRAKQRLPTPPPPIVFRWDLDKTYLKTEFDTWRELVRVPFQKPQDKITVPGVATLLRTLRDTAVQAGREVRIYFISASPPQIGKAIRAKLALDGIEYDDITFKNQLQHLMHARFRNLREQVGFKLTELLKSRPNMPADAREVLFGDDWESDPIIYSLYADVVAGRIGSDELVEILGIIGVDPKLIVESTERAAAITHRDAVAKIYINLERRTPPTSFRAFGARLVPTYNYFQTAVCLFEDGHLTLSGVAQVAEALITASGYTPDRMANSLADITRRGHLQSTNALALREYLHARGLISRRVPAPPRRTWRQRVWRRLVRWLKPPDAAVPITPEAINYQTLVTEWRTTH
jgi:hypothetical protein